MKKTTWVTLPAFALATLIGLQGCAKKTTPSSLADGSQNTGDASTNAGANSGTGFNSSDIDGLTAANVLSRLPVIYFDFDQSSLREKDRQLLKVISEALKMDANKTVALKIQGHCDERGSTEYNLALGERRSRSIYDYLSNLGVSKSKLDVVSFGEERPAMTGSSEDSWAKNRRAEFNVQR